MKRTYLDHAATTPMLPQARAAVAAAFEQWANPSSPHAEGRAARAALERARATVADALEWRHEVIFTSGASEAVGLVAERALPSGRIVGATEHDVVLQAMGAGAVRVGVNRDGIVDLDAFEQALARGPALVAMQHVNNETGVLQPIDDIGRVVREAGSLLLVDCAQSAGKLDLPGADFIAVSAHKLGGPPGIGALLVRDLATLAPSGGQEKGYRRGTQDMPAAAGFAAALEAGSFRHAVSRLAKLRQRLDLQVIGSGGTVIAGEVERSPAVGTISMPGVTAASLLVQLDLAGFAVSAGSACSSGSMKPSHVLAAMAVPPELAAGAVRVSFGPHTGDDDIDAFVREWTRISTRMRSKAA